MRMGVSKKYVVRLPEEERTTLRCLISVGKAAARKIVCAHVLLQADEGPDGSGWPVPCTAPSTHDISDFNVLGLKSSSKDGVDPRFGFMLARIQSSFLFFIQVCINGRQWLSRRLDETGLPYDRYENGFPWIDDFAKAQTIMDRMHEINWPRCLMSWQED